MGRFTLRLPDSLHHELEARAQREGVSLNQYIVYTLTRQVAAEFTIELTPDAHIREQKARFEALLRTLGSASEEAAQAALDERELAEPETGLSDEVAARVKQRIARRSGPAE